MDSDSDHSDSMCVEPLSPFKNDHELEKERGFSPEMLKFSIENILRPDFGCKIKQERLSPQPQFSPLHSMEDQSKCLPNTGASWPPAWVFCTRYSDRPSAGPRSRRPKRRAERKPEDKRPRTAFTQEQLDRLKKEFQESRYLTEKRRQDLAKDLQLNESQIKIWFQNKRAKLKKSNGCRNSLAFSLLSHGLYNHHGQQDDQEVDQFCNS